MNNEEGGQDEEVEVGGVSYRSIDDNRDMQYTGMGFPVVASILHGNGCGGTELVAIPVYRW